MAQGALTAASSKDAAGDTVTVQQRSHMKVTLLSGFLGAGKTTLMRNLLRQARDRNMSVAVIVNDMAAINIDAQLLTSKRLAPRENAGGNEQADVVYTTGHTPVAMQDGCICCTLASELLDKVSACPRYHCSTNMAGVACSRHHLVNASRYTQDNRANSSPIVREWSAEELRVIRANRTLLVAPLTSRFGP